MERFDSIYEAVRCIREKLPEITADHEELYLMISEDNTCFWVTEDESDLEDELRQSFYDWGYDGKDPEQHAESFKILAYVTSNRKERWEILYRDFKRTPLSKNHIRGKAKHSGEVLASFSVSTC